MATSQTTSTVSNEATVTSDVTSSSNDDVTIAPPSYESACASGTIQGAPGDAALNKDPEKPPPYSSVNLPPAYTPQSGEPTYPAQTTEPTQSVSQYVTQCATSEHIPNNTHPPWHPLWNPHHSITYQYPPQASHLSSQSNHISTAAILNNNQSNRSVRNTQQTWPSSTTTGARCTVITQFPIGQQNMDRNPVDSNIRAATGTYLLLSILTCLCCSPAFGCLAICFSLAAQQAADQGDWIKARSRGQSALICCIIGIFVSALSFMYYMSGGW